MVRGAPLSSSQRERFWHIGRGSVLGSGWQEVRGAGIGVVALPRVELGVFVASGKATVTGNGTDLAWQWRPAYYRT